MSNILIKYLNLIGLVQSLSKHIPKKKKTNGKKYNKINKLLFIQNKQFLLKN